MGQRRDRIGALLVAVAWVLAGCSGARPLVAFVGSPSAAPVWDRSDLMPIGMPVGVNGIALDYVLDDSNLYLLGIDPVTGKTLWQHQASPGEVDPGFATYPRIIGDKVAYFRPDHSGFFTQLVLADPRTGKDAVSTPDGQMLVFDSPPFACGNGDVCAISHTGNAQNQALHQLRVSDGQYVAANVDGLAAGAGVLDTSGLLDLGGRSSEEFGVVRDAKLVWRTRVSDAFPAGFSTDNGWDWELSPDRNVYAGTLHPVPTDHADLKTINASAGVSAATGKVLWRDSGSAIDCRSSIFVAADPEDQNSPVIPVRCRYGGTETRANGYVKFSNLDITIEGYDVATGKTTWSLPVGNADNLTGVTNVTLPAIAGPGLIVVQANKTPVVLDLTTGKQQTPAAGVTFWCPIRNEFNYRDAYTGPGPRAGTHTRRGSELAGICDAKGDQAQPTPGVAATRTVGLNIASVTIVATMGGLNAYQTNPSSPQPTHT
jgi:outer membrane protein assembly factor BamB